MNRLDDLADLWSEPIIVDTPKSYLLFKTRQEMLSLKRKRDTYLERYNQKILQLVHKMDEMKTIIPSDLTSEQRVEYRKLFEEHKKLWGQSSGRGVESER